MAITLCAKVRGFWNFRDYSKVLVEHPALEMRCELICLNLYSVLACTRRRTKAGLLKSRLSHPMTSWTALMTSALKNDFFPP